MSSGSVRVVRMVNDIAAQFGYLSEEQAAEHVAAHVRSFWDPRMRDDLLALGPIERRDLSRRADLAATLLAEAP